MPRLFQTTNQNLIEFNPMPSGDTSSIINCGCWLKTTQGSGSLICSDNGSGSGRVLQFTTASGKIQGILFSSGGGSAFIATGASSVNDGAWHHVLLSYDGTTMRIYVDGGLDGSHAATAGNTLASKRLRIGAQIPGVTNTFYAGTIAEAFIRYSAISAGEAKALAAGLPASHLKADHYWPIWGKDSPEPDIGTGTHVAGVPNPVPPTSGFPAFASGGKVGKELLVL